MRYKSLFFDLDDTLWATYQNNTECLEELYTAHNLGRYYTSFEAFLNIYWPHNDQLWEAYRKGTIDRKTLIVERFRYMLQPLGIEDTKSVLAINNEFLQRTTKKTRLIEGAIDILDYLHPNYRLFILSNGFHEVQLKKLVNSGLAPYFEKMILSEDAGIQKPQKGIFDYALVNTNSTRKGSLMIGDSWEADIEGARNAQIDQLWLNPNKLKPHKFKPTYTVGTLNEIMTIL